MSAERADAYLHGLLTPEEADRFERDLEADPRLRADLDRARRRLAIIEAALPPVEASEDLVRTTLRRLAAARRSGRWRGRVVTGLLAPLAAACLVIGLFHLHYRNMAASPLDLEVYGQNELMADTDAVLHVRLTDRATKSPVVGAPVVVSIGEPGTPGFARFEAGTTDARGFARPSVRLPDLPSGSYPLRVSAGPEALVQSVKVKRSFQVMLGSDKPVYQPGQVIHIRALALRRPDRLPVQKAEAVFTVRDPHGNTILRTAVATSEFGIAATDCPLADEIAEGTYKLGCQIGDTASDIDVRVERYVLPKMKLAVKPDRPWYLFGEKLTGTLEATYIHGEPVVGAEWAIDGPGGQQAGKTDAAGRAVFTFLLPPGGGHEIELRARVQDSAGQEQTRSARVPVAAQPLKLEVIPESGRLVRGVANMVYVYASTPDGAPARVSGIARVDNETTKFQTGPLGIGTLELSPQGATVNVSLQATDAQGRTSGQGTRLDVGRTSADFLVRTDRAVYDGGRTMTVTVLGGGTGPVFLDFLKDGQALRTETVEVTNGQGVATFDLPPDLDGTLELCAWRFDDAGRPVRKQRVVYVRPVKALAVTATADRPEYRPGETATVTFTLTDDRGRPGRGAVSLAVVDEAVFEVLQRMPGMERTFYLLERDLLKPVYATYPGWAPDEAAAAGPERTKFEQALFAKTARSDEPPIALATASPRQAKAAPSPASAGGPHTLAVSSYYAKSLDVARAQRLGLDWVGIAWRIVLVVALLVIDAILWLTVRTWIVLVIHAIGAFGLCLVTAITMLGTGAKSTFDGVAGSAAPAAKADRGAAMEMAAPSQAANPPLAAPPGMPGMPGGPGAPKAPVRVREQFPETLLWVPQLVTDDAGRATLTVPLADSITTWRLSASAVDGAGRLGATQVGIRAFQPFFVDLNLPVALTRGDEIEVPAVASNYLAEPQTVTVTLKPADWFALIGPAEATLELGPREVKKAAFRIQAKAVGKFDLEVTARSAKAADALRRQVTVNPDGRPVERVINGTLTDPARMSLTVPPDAVEGSPRATLKIYPSSFSQLVEGMDGIFRMPTGCFEQTSSTLYPNVLALSYLRRANKSVPAVEAKARQYIHLGYQRLLTFEVPGGGFEWYGRPPANVLLTAYGLLEFRDMAEVHDVDPALIERTRRWLLSQRQPDGSWGGDLRTTAYVAWAVFPGPGSDTTHQYLLRHPADSINDPYTLALVSNALIAIDGSIEPYLQRLEALKRSSADGRMAWWELPPGSRTAFYGAGGSGNVEATALTVLAMLQTKQNSATTRAALAWLVAQRDANGTWGSTQATVLALKALVAGTSSSTGGKGRSIEVKVEDRVVQRLDIPAAEDEVTKQLDLTPFVKPGETRLEVRDATGSGAGYQVALRYHVPEAVADAGPLAIDVAYDRETVTVGDMLQVRARVTNTTPRPAPMVMVELPAPAGFAVEAEDFRSLEAAGRIARFEMAGPQVIVYLRELPPGRPLELRYRLRAVTPANVTVSPARVYEYYDPSKQGRGKPVRLTISERK